MDYKIIFLVFMVTGSVGLPATQTNQPVTSIQPTPNYQTTSETTNQTTLNSLQQKSSKQVQQTNPNVVKSTPKTTLDIFTVINELTSNKSMSNDTLEFLINVIGDKNSMIYFMLPTILQMDTRTPIALLKKVLVHPDYSIKMLDALSQEPVLAKIILTPVFDNSTITGEILPLVFSSQKLTLKLLEMLTSNPDLAKLTVNGIFKSIDAVLPLIGNYSHLLHTIIGDVIGNDMNKVDMILEFFGNLTLPTDSLLGSLISNPDLASSLTPVLQEILSSPILGNYLFSKLLENKQLVQNVETVLLSSPEMLETITKFKGDPMVGEQILGLALQHPEFANTLISKIISKPDIVVKLIAKVIEATPLKDSLIAKFLLQNQVVVGNLIKFFQGRNDSGVMLPPIFIPAFIRNLFSNTKLGSILANLNSGKIKTFQQLLGLFQGILQNLGEIPDSIFRFLLKNVFVGNNPGNSTNTNEELISTLIQDALSNTTIGILLGSVRQGDVPNLGQVVALAQNLFQHINEVPTILGQLAVSAENNLKDQCAVDSVYSAVALFQLKSWALKFIDASGKPERDILKGNIRFMGAYDECSEISELITNTHGSHLIEGGYCELAFTIPDAFFNAFAKSAAAIEGVSHDLRIDLCLPKSCGEDQIDTVLNKTLVNLLGAGLSTIHCIKDKSLKGDVGAYVAIAVFSFLALLCVLGTAYDVCRSLKKNDDEEEVMLQESERNGHVGPVVLLTKFDGSEDDGISKPQKEEFDQKDNPKNYDKMHGILSEPSDRPNRFLMAFSIRENGKKILNTAQPKGSLTCLNGIRVISMSWIIIGHILTTFNTTVGMDISILILIILYFRTLDTRNFTAGIYATLNITSENSTEALEFIQTFSFQVMLNAPLAVDTFFVLSGLLVCYLFVKEIDKVGRIRCQHMFLYYFHRIWRLTPLYALVLLFYACLSQYLASGPFDDEHPEYRENCRTYWWRNLLYINTLFETKEICMLWSWYLSHDMIFYIVSPMVIVPLSLGYKKIGFFLIFAMVCIHVVTYGYFEWTIGSGSQLFHNYEYMNEVYLKPWCRVGVYAIGLALGYIIFKTKLKYKFRRTFLMIGYLIATGVSIFIIYITYLEHKKEDPHWTVEYRIAHETICRPVWALCVCWVVFTCVNGQGGFINSILSWGLWVPLTKITYGAYLLHLLLIDNIIDSNMRATYYLDIFHVIFEFVSVFVLSYAFSFIFSLLIEAPCMGLEKILIKKRK